MSNRTKKAALGLAAVIISSLLAGCSGAQDTSGTTAPAQTGTGEATTQAKTEEVRINPDLPEKDYGGYVFRILSKGSWHPHWVAEDVDAEALNGEVINDAVYNRNLKVEEQFNVKITELTTPTDNMLGYIRKAVQADEDSFDMVSMSLNGVVNYLIEDQMLIDLNTIPYMDLSKPWYDQNANKSLSIGGKLYATVGDISIMDNEAAWVLLFNKKLAESYAVPNLYQVVRNGAWTIDKLNEVMKDVPKDLNGDGVMDEFDQYGIINEAYNVLAFCMAAGENVAKKDTQDIPYISLGSERFLAAFQKGMDMVNNKTLTLYYNDYGAKYPGTDSWTQCIDPAFSSDRVLFYMTGMDRVKLFRSMDTDFGIIPLPKLDEQQESYYSPVHMWCTSSIAIPVTNRDTERTGVIIEALSAESLYTLTPAYFDVALRTKFSRDEDSYEMLDLIFQTRVYDIGHMNNWSGAYQLSLDLATKGSYDFASSYEKIAGKVESALQKSLDMITAE